MVLPRIVLAFFCLLPTVYAQTAESAPSAALPGQAERIQVTYLDGRTTRVEVLELREHKVRLRSHLYGASVVHWAEFDQFEPASRYSLLLAAGRPRSAAEHFAVAKRAGAWRLLDLTAAHLRSALAAAAGEADAAALQDQVHAWAAAWLEEIVTESIAAGRLREAERRLEILCSRLSERCSEDRLEELAGQVDALRERQEAERQQQRQARLQERTKVDIQARMKPILAQIEAGDRRMREALRNSRRTAQTTRLAGSALDAYRAAWAEAQKLQKAHPDHDELAAELGALAVAIEERSVKASLHAANAMTMQSDFRQAMDWVERALEIDPDNADAKELRHTILIASAAAGGFGWGFLPVRESGRAR